MKKSTLLSLCFLSLFSISAFGQAAFTADKFSGCAPLIVQFTDQSTGATSWAWDFGNTNTSALPSPSAQYNNPGTYTVRLTINGGSSTVTHTIIVFQSPVSTFALDDDTTCVGGIINFTNTSTPGSASIIKYIWSFGDGTKDSTSGPNVSHSFTLTGIFSINLVVIDGNNCQSASSQNTRIYVISAPAPKFSMTPPSTCAAPVTVTFNNQTTPAATSYIWTFGDPASGPANVSLLTNPTHTYTAAGQYTVVLTTKTGTCFTKDSMIFYAKTIVADFSTGSDTVCLNSPVLFYNISNPPANTASWNFGDPGSGASNTSTLISPSHLFSAPGTYSVSVTVSNGCQDTKTKTIVVMPKPVMSFTTPDDTSYCQPPALIHFQSTSNPSLVSWQWYFEDIPNGFKDSINNPDTIYTFLSYGHYSVRLIGTDIYGCMDTGTKLNYITIEAPTVSITTSADSGCIQKTIQFKDTITLAPGDSVLQYYWNFGDGSTLSSTSYLPSVTNTYTTCGIYNVSDSIVTKKGCTAIDIKNGWARAGLQPTAKFVWNDTTVCYGDNVQFTDSSKANGCQITAWVWSFGSFDQSPSWAFQDTGKQSVNLKVYSYGCMDSLRKDTIITVHPPKPFFDFVKPTCADHDTVQFNDLSEGADSLVWDFDDGTKDTTNNKNPRHGFPGRGSYVVKLTAYNYTYGCAYSYSKTVTITAPLAIITGTPQDCHPFLANLGNASVDAANYSWDFGDPFSGNNSSVLPTDTHTYFTPRTYAVKLTVTDIYGCTDDTTVTYHALGPLASMPQGMLKGCRPFTANLTSTSVPEGSVITTYFWNFNYPSPTDTATSFVNPTAHTYTQNGIYTVMLVATDANGCRDTTINQNYIEVTFPAPQFNNIDTFVCDKTSVPFSINANGTAPFTYQWSFGDGQPDSVISNSPFGNSTVTHNYQFNDTVFKLSVKVTDANGCDSTISQNITVLRPKAKFTATQADSCGYTTPNYFTPMGDSINGWNWQIAGPFGFTAGSSLTNPNFQFTIPGKYYSTLTVTNPGCSDSYTDSSIFMPGPIAYFTDVVNSQCPPVKVVFTSHLVNNQQYSYVVWDFGDGTTGRAYSPDSVVTHTYYSPGTFNPSAQIVYTLSSGRICSITDSSFSPPFTVIQTFSVNVTQDSIVIKEGQQDTLTSVLTTGSSVPPYTYTWNVTPGGAVLPVDNVTNAIYTAVENDNMIILTVQDSSGCEAYDTVYVKVKLCETNIKVPNVFTPNGDNLNEYYHINDICDIDDFRITIYNRWGNVVYESSQFDFKWDGKDSNGKECSEGVYYYIIHGKRKNLYGYIHLIRD